MDISEQVQAIVLELRMLEDRSPDSKRPADALAALVRLYLELLNKNGGEEVISLINIAMKKLIIISEQPIEREIGE